MDDNFIKAHRLPFPKSAMMAELRENLLVLARHIDIACGPEAAAAFAGFPTTTDDDDFPYAADDPDKIDLTLFRASDGMELAFDYAFQVGRFFLFDEATEQWLRAFSYGIPEWAADSRRTPYHSVESKCRHVAEMALGRYELEFFDGTPTIRQLALLAGMSEAAVRNLLRADGIRTRGKPAHIDNEAARRWLARWGYIPTRHVVNLSSGPTTPTRSFSSTA